MSKQNVQVLGPRSQVHGRFTLILQASPAVVAPKGRGSLASREKPQGGGRFISSSSFQMVMLNSCFLRSMGPQPAPPPMVKPSASTKVTFIK